jgi:cytochrome c551/c552
MRRFQPLLLLILLCSPAALAADEAAEKVRFFEENVRPVLAKSCLGCHNDDTKMSGLSLATREGAMLGGNRGSAVIPGQPQDSLLVQAIRRDGDIKMPPTGPLPAEDSAALAAWVADGAVWGEASGRTRATASHWAFQPIERPEPPAVKDAKWARSPIDRFILAKIEEKGIGPSPEADKRTLIRRVSLDLRGLPPSPEEVRGFLADDSADAYEKLVDRLLESPAYGERWGRHWLDIARYADSNGYSIDGARSIWRYRDWVINALNDDMPFDQFVI